MRFRYIDVRGREVEVSSSEALASRIRLGAITSSTQLYDAGTDRWGPAHTHEIYRQTVEDAGGEIHSPPPVEPSVAPTSGPTDEPSNPPSGASSGDEVAADRGRTAAESDAPAAEGDTVRATDGGAGAVAAGSDAGDGAGGESGEESGAAGDEAEPQGPNAAAGDLDGFPRVAFSMETLQRSRSESPLPRPNPSHWKTTGPPKEETAEEEPPAPATPSAEPESTAGSRPDPDPWAGEDRLDPWGDEDVDGPPDPPDPGPTRARDAAQAPGLTTSSGSAAADGAPELEDPDALEAPTDSDGADAPADEDADDWLTRGTPEGFEDDPFAIFAGTAPRSDGPEFDSWEDAAEPLELPGGAPLPGDVAPGAARDAAPGKSGPFAGPVVRALVAAVVLLTGAGAFMAMGRAPEETPEEAALRMRAERRARIAAALPMGADTTALADGAFLDMIAGMDSLQRAYRLNEKPSPRWLEGIYLANASRFPEVIGYWTRYRAYLDEARQRSSTFFEDAYRARLRTIGVAPGRIDALVDDAMRHFERTEERRASMYAQMEELARASVELHELLLAREDDIAYEPFTTTGISRDPVLEAVPATPELEEEMWVLISRITGALERIDTLQAFSTQRILEAMFDSLATSSGTSGTAAPRPTARRGGAG